MRRGLASLVLVIATLLLGCGGDETSTAELPPFAEVTDVIEHHGETIELVNAGPIQLDFTQWMLERFDEAGLEPLHVGVVWFPPSEHCIAQSGLAVVSDDRFGGRPTVVVCFDESHVSSSLTSSGWAPSAIAYGLHELAHLWLVDHVDGDTEARFDERIGATTWNGAEEPWHRRGVEHAAFTIAWGLAGTHDARYPIDIPSPRCDEMVDRFVLLTGHRPLTDCPSP